MSVSLDPIVARKLRQFKRRRRTLILARGLCAGVVTFLLFMAVVAAIDWYWLLNDETRWYLSGAAYLTVITTVWLTCLRRMMHLPAMEEIATQMEQTEPQLRENLLSAVELATDDPTAIHDSPVFRSLLQGKVAEQMGQIRVPNLLPMKLVSKWLLAAVATVAVVAMLLSSGDTRFRQLAARAMLPGANIARVSRIHVEVLKPTPHSLTLAEDETIAVLVEVTGGNVKEVTLETFTPNQGAVRQSMRGQAASEYVANIHVADESVEYRILAGDAITQRFRIESRSRPRVTAFHKSYEYPKYTGLPDESVTEKHGDLLVLEGTKVEIVMELDQQVTDAELRVDPSNSEEMRVIPLTPAQQKDPSEAAAFLWKATLPIEEAAIYKVHLVSEETGFENIFSPKYEIQPQPDLIPRTGFVDQQETTLLLPPNDILALKAMAEDDLPLVSLEQQISVNGREWETMALETELANNSEGRELTAAWQWDLVLHQLKTGDQVMTKLVATDRKGNSGESIPLRIIVASQDFDPQRHAIMQRKIGLYSELADFADLLQEQKVSALETIERLRQPDRSDEVVMIDRTSLIDIANKQREQAGKLLEEIKSVERDMPAGADAYDLDLTGQVIARLQREHTNVPAYLLKAMQHTEDEKRLKADLDELKRTFERTADDAKNVATHYQQLMSHNFLNAIAFDLNALLRQQQLVVNSPTQTWQRLMRQETIAINQLQVLDSLIRDQRQRLPIAIDRQMVALIKWIEIYRQRLQDSMESEEKLAELRKVSIDFLRQLEQKQKYDTIDGGLPARLIGARRDFVNRSGSLYVPLEQIARATRQENLLVVQASESDDSANGKNLSEQAERYVAEVDLKQRRSLDQLRSRRELTQTRPDSDSQYAADAGLTHRAVTSLLNQHRQGTVQESTIPDNLLEIAPAYRTLEAGHNLMIVNDALDVLLNMERWGSQGISAHMDHPRQWDVVNQGFELASRRLREAKIDQELISKVDQLRGSSPVRDAGRKIGERRWKREAMIGAGHELVEIREELRSINEDLKPVMAEARAVIAKYAPTIPQMAQQAADQLRELEKETTETADAVEKPESPDPQTQQQLSELKQQQAAINQQLEDLTEALVEDANSQDLLEDNQRERARDADDSIAMIQEPAKQMNQAMQQARESESGEQQAKDLAQAAEQQEKTAQALELVAEHFADLNEGLDVAESRAELRQAEQELGIAQQMNQRFEETQQLAEMANQEAQDLMAELDAELQRNPAMQQALSEIAQNTLQEARNALEYAALDDENLQKSNERSDTEFQTKKKALAADLRNMGAEASQLSRYLLAQANQSANQGKSVEAQQKIIETQQKLNEAVAIANTANESQLLDDLAKVAQETKATLGKATETLKQAKQQTAIGKETKVHADDKAREAQKKDSESRRKKFHEQQKKIARDIAKRADDAKRRTDQNVRNAENQARKVESQINQAKKNLQRKPEDAGLKRNLAQAEARLTAEKVKVAATKKLQKEAEQLAKEKRRKSNEVNAKKLPPLDAQNPATQLADNYAEEAIKVAEKLNQQADQLAKSTDFEKELTPTKNQLVSAEKIQNEITEDVQKAAEDVSRAARHERRLKNQAAADPLQNTAKEIQQVANNESAIAEQQLNTATAEAEQGEEDSSNNKPQQNDKALQAQAAVAATEKALSNQAEKLSDVLEPILAAAEAAANPDAAQSPAEGSAPEANPQAGDPGQQAASPNNAQAGEKSSQPVSPANGQPTPPSFTPEEQALGRQLAQTLDELDRQQAAANAAETGEPAQQSPPNSRPLDTLAQAAQAQQASLSATRLQAQQQAAMAMSEGATESSDNPAATGILADFTVQAVNRNENANWGKLRNKSADDLTNGKSEAISEEYRKSVETYFRVLAERARKKK